MTLLIDVPAASAASASTNLLGDLVAIGRHLQAEDYHFTAVSPQTQARMLSRAGDCIGTSLREIFGWNLPFGVGALPRPIFERMRRGGLAVAQHGLLRSVVGFATLNGHLYAHDAYPATSADTVSFGPDIYRFAAALRAQLRPCDLLVEVCCGTGVGGLESGVGLAQRVVLTDNSPRALTFAAANRLLARNTGVILQPGDLLAGIDERPDAIIANLPYLSNPLARTRHDDGGILAHGLALRVIREAIELLAPGGQLLLYTGTPIIDGTDRFAAAALPLAWNSGVDVAYEEIDPDVFSEELDGSSYAAVERIAAVILSLKKPRM